MSSATVKLKIDGTEIAVPATKSAYDPQYKKNVTVPTTVHDAALALAQQTGQPCAIPVLCHREHIRPVAVCRVCCVEVGNNPRVLSPACYLPVSEGMEVKTAESSPRVATTVKTVLQLLMADHPHGTMPTPEKDNELDQLARQYQVHSTPFAAPRVERGRDDSSFVIAVDHDACILCDRCVRACCEIKNNHVIGRMGKGYEAKIAFDLNTPMGDSTCVACGECAVSCPTGALSLRAQVETEAWKGVRPEPKKVLADELAEHPLFEGVSRAFLRWNEGAVVRRSFKKGDIICREGDYGSTAFYLEKGKVKIYLQASASRPNEPKAGGFLGFLSRFSFAPKQRAEEKSPTRFIHPDAPVVLDTDKPVAQLEAGDLFGEMTCMSRYPRSATVQAEEDCTVLEMLSNVLYILQRNRKSRAWLEERYRTRAVDNHLRSVPLFTDVLNPQEFQRFLAYMRPRVILRRLNPGEVVFRQGDKADNFYMIRVGFVKVSKARPGGDQEVTYLGPGGSFGEIGLLSHLPEMAGKTRAGTRTATCAALDHVDLIQISPKMFEDICRAFPALKDHFLTKARAYVEQDEQLQAPMAVPLKDFLEQGLMNAQSLLVLDLHKCTRCDECTKACSDSHGGVTRLVREGLRFDKYLVASSCRSCLDPYCMIGCPVNAIRRRKTQEIVIEPWCIGCGLCSNNCPYGNINMIEVPKTREDPEAPGKMVAYQQSRATVCDLCMSLDGNPSCVYACPHDAAHRMTGMELLQEVQGSAK